MRSQEYSTIILILQVICSFLPERLTYFNIPSEMTWLISSPARLDNGHISTSYSIMIWHEHLMMFDASLHRWGFQISCTLWMSAIIEEATGGWPSPRFRRPPDMARDGRIPWVECSCPGISWIFNSVLYDFHVTPFPCHVSCLSMSNNVMFHVIM